MSGKNSNQSPIVIRQARPDDDLLILDLNKTWEAFLSPMGPARLAELRRMAGYLKIAEIDGTPAGFLMAFREGVAYDSANYRWFANRYDRFMYIDRIVISGAYQGKGIGKEFYVDLFREVAAVPGCPVCCEYDIDPPNEHSRRFHDAFGFVEVGQQRPTSEPKIVSLQIRQIT